jgi:quinoprotein glucose dehydrogenase
MRVAGSAGLAALMFFACADVAAARHAHKAKHHAQRKAVAASTPARIPDGDWRTINRDLAATRYSPLSQINRSNVSRLAVAWTYPMKGYNTAAPLVIGGVMYFPAGNRVVALDADSGKEIWSFTAQPDPNATGPGRGGFSTRGVSYWAGDATSPARILVMQGARMLALDAASGQPARSFGTDGYVSVGVSFGGVPTIADGVIEIGAATTEDPLGVPGNSRAYDVKTGRKLWEFQNVPGIGQRGHETWGEIGWWGRSGTNQWGFMAPVDEAKGVIYIPVGNPSPNYWGGDRPGANLYGNTVLALDIRTGKYLWHFQTVHHDLWDIDQPSDGPLLTLNMGGKTREAIVAVNKSSWFFELDANTGKPLIPVEERPVPKGDVPGEYYSPTQPFPVRPGPLSRVSMTKDDMVTAEDTTPEHAAACKAMWDKAGGFYNAGAYTPFMFHKDGDPPRSTIQLPGGTGGVNWGGAAADVKTGWVYVNAQATSLVGWVEKRDPKGPSYSFDAPFTDQPYDRASVDGKGPFFSFSAPLNGQYDEKGRAVGPQAPCYKPPWGQLEAVDANTGEIKWKVPLGVFDTLPAGRQALGNSGSAGPSVTAGGLVFVGATNDKRFRAFDASSGRQLWEAPLAANANANPISYAGRSGKQFVAINAGGTITAFALPR